jgi:hypothetical protein
VHENVGVDDASVHLRRGTFHAFSLGMNRVDLELTWNLQGEEIAARTGHTATALDSHRILIVGGWDYSDAQSEPKRFDDAYILDTSTDSG